MNNLLRISEVITFEYCINGHFFSVLINAHSSEKVNHLAFVVVFNYFVFLNQRILGYKGNVCLRIVFVAWSPSWYYLGNCIQLVTLNVIAEYYKGCTAAPFHFRELFKGVVTWFSDLTFPVIPHPYVQWVVVPDSPWNLVLF